MNDPYNLNGYDLRKIFRDRSLDRTETGTLIALICWLSDTGGGNIPTREFAELSGQAIGNVGKQFASLIKKGAIHGGKRQNVTHKMSWAIDSIDPKYCIDDALPPIQQECRSTSQAFHAFHEKIGQFIVTVTIPGSKDGEKTSTTP